MANDLAVVFTRGSGQAAAFLATILVSFCLASSDKTIFELGREVNESNAYIKFWRNRVTTRVANCSHIVHRK